MNISENAYARMMVVGRVQKVGFRWFVAQKARAIGVTGYVKNLDDGSVLVESEGGRKFLLNFIKELQTGPLGAHVDKVEIKWLPFEERFQGFDIRY